MKMNLNHHFISLVADDYDTSTTLLTDSEHEQIVLMANPALLRSTWLGKPDLKQYDPINPSEQQPNPCKDPSPFCQNLNSPLIKVNPKKLDLTNHYGSIQPKT